MKRIDRIIQYAREFLDIRFNDNNREILSVLLEHEKLLELVEKEAPQTYIKYIQQFHDEG